MKIQKQIMAVALAAGMSFATLACSSNNNGQEGMRNRTADPQAAQQDHQQSLSGSGTTANDSVHNGGGSTMSGTTGASSTGQNTTGTGNRSADQNSRGRMHEQGGTTGSTRTK